MCVFIHFATRNALLAKNTNVFYLCFQGAKVRGTFTPQENPSHERFRSWWNRFDTHPSSFRIRKVVDKELTGHRQGFSIAVRDWVLSSVGFHHSIGHYVLQMVMSQSETHAVSWYVVSLERLSISITKLTY